MKQNKIKEVLRVAVSAALAVGLFGSMLLGVNHLTLQASTNGETYLPPAEYVSVPESPVSDEIQVPKVTIINTTYECTEIPAIALPLDEAAQIGAQYIYDIFGKCIDGMYVELSFMGSERHMTRNIWSGVVSDRDRGTLERMAQSNQLTEEFQARVDAGECPRDVRMNMEDLSIFDTYTPGDFYFMIDAVTGERIDISRPSRGSFNFSIDESRALHEYLERRWGRDTSAAFVAEISPRTQEELGHIARDYGQRHFVNTTVTYVEFAGAWASFILSGNNTFDRVVYVSFVVTDSTGRVASVAVALESHTVSAISTMRNDFIPRYVSFDASVNGEWSHYRAIEEYDGELIRRIPMVEDVTELE